MLRSILFLACFIVVAWAVIPPAIQEPPALATALQLSVSRAQFGAYIEELSEPEGYFDTDNFISNETSYLHVIEELRQRVRPGGVYLGVGPDQNFSYIAHTRPSLAVVVDIRRQNMLQHLLYKAVFELSASRAEFLARLFSYDTPRVNSGASLRDILVAVRRSPSSEARYRSNLAAVRERVQAMGLKLSNQDLDRIEYVYRTLHDEGLDLRFSSIGRNNAANYPTFESLLLQTDRTGKQQGFLSTEDLFLWMKKFQGENRLIPIVGDFSGSAAFKATAAFLKSNALEVHSFYTSNVEYYLFGTPKWANYIQNVRMLPMARDAVFIRAYFGNSGPHPQNVPGHRSTSLVQSVADLLRLDSSGRLRSYEDFVF